MDKKRLMGVLLLPIMFVLFGHHVTAQNPDAATYRENARIDSLAQADRQHRMDQSEKRQDSETLSDLKSERRKTKASAREARRVEIEANDAARQSKAAYRKEKKAQKARLQADKQSKKAAKARAVSDQN